MYYTVTRSALKPASEHWPKTFAYLKKIEASMPGLNKTANDSKKWLTCLPPSGTTEINDESISKPGAQAALAPIHPNSIRVECQDMRLIQEDMIGTDFGSQGVPRRATAFNCSSSLRMTATTATLPGFPR